MARISSRARSIGALSLLGLTTAALGRFALQQARRLDLRGRVVVITGGSRGLGLLLAEEFGRRGARIAICGRDVEALRAAEHRLRSMGIEALARPADLGEQRVAEMFINRVVLEWDRIDVLVNNAGVINVAPLEDMPVESLEESMRSNFWSAAYTTMAALPHLRVHGADARIVNIVSIGGRVPVPHLLAYCASKFAMMGFSEGLDVELRKSGVKVTSVIPGVMRTGSIYNAQFGGRARDEFAWFGLSASLPIFSKDARGAARRIVRAAQIGAREIHIGLPAYLGSLLHAVAPRLTLRLAELANRLLPGPGGIDGKVLRGRDIDAKLQRSPLLALSNSAARRHNEAPPEAAK